MRLGIVGHAQEKFTPETETKARKAIYDEIEFFQLSAKLGYLQRPLIGSRDFVSNERWLKMVIISGHSPMGGVDIYAEEIARDLGIPTIIHKPEVNQWDPPGKIGFKRRNLAIARDSDLVLCVVISPKALPAGFSGMQFDECYHCRRYSRLPVLPHIKSGGCWTAWKCRDRKWRIIE